MRLLATIVAVAALAGCGAMVGEEWVRAPAGGTAVKIDGQVCGQPVKIEIADINDRGSFTARCFDPATGQPILELSTSERNASTAIEAMAIAVQRQTETIADVVARVPP